MGQTKLHTNQATSQGAGTLNSTSFEVQQVLGFFFKSVWMILSAKNIKPLQKGKWNPKQTVWVHLSTYLLHYYIWINTFYVLKRQSRQPLISYSHTHVRRFQSMMEGTEDGEHTSYSPSGEQAYAVQTHLIMFAHWQVGHLCTSENTPHIKGPWL